MITVFYWRLLGLEESRTTRAQVLPAASQKMALKR